MMAMENKHKYNWLLPTTNILEAPAQSTTRQPEDTPASTTRQPEDTPAQRGGPLFDPYKLAEDVARIGSGYDPDVAARRDAGPNLAPAALMRQRKAREGLYGTGPQKKAMAARDTRGFSRPEDLYRALKSMTLAQASIAGQSGEYGLAGKQLQATTTMRGQDMSADESSADREARIQMQQERYAWKSEEDKKARTARLAEIDREYGHRAAMQAADLDAMFDRDRAAGKLVTDEAGDLTPEYQRVVYDKAMEAFRQGEQAVGFYLMQTYLERQLAKGEATKFEDGPSAPIAPKMRPRPAIEPPPPELEEPEDLELAGTTTGQQDMPLDVNRDGTLDEKDLTPATAPELLREFQSDLTQARTEKAQLLRQNASEEQIKRADRVISKLEQLLKLAQSMMPQE